MLTTRDFQEGVVHEPGWGAVLDPIFLLLAGVFLLTIGVMLYLAIHAGDSSSRDGDGES